MVSYIAGVQDKFYNGEVDRNLKKIRSIVSKTKELQPEAELILFPELAATGYFLSEELYDVAENQGGRIEGEMSQLATEFGVILAYGYVEQGEDDKIYNSLKVINEAGKTIGNYRKIHLTPLEKGYFTPGNEVVLIESSMGKLGLMICWDLAFPELARELACKGAHVVLAPSAWELPYNKPYNRFGMARAIDNTLFLVTVNHVGKSGELEFFGESGIYGPDGERIAGADNDEQIIFARLDQEIRKEWRKDFFSMLDERRVDVYKI
ncbi:carbon-nitrogen hydrolase family protein [Evansella clarkii]|uniref:carbon-nitrogen hydrolase family protein n=1 Tax=Evansella clarkii TaxID=79879 RepID=UPI000B43171F|nr:carbon-nitrogen hydrolase family protein [Evansella clarkii]